jgi:uncharacterized membrane protein YdfJ with MMPL/SSD domain
MPAVAADASSSPICRSETSVTPALTALIGHAAWWPGHGDQAVPAATGDDVAARAGKPLGGHA